MGKTPSSHCPRLELSPHSGELLPLAPELKWLFPTSLCSWICSGVHTGSSLISLSVLDDAPCCDRKSCASAAPPCCPQLCSPGQAAQERVWGGLQRREERVRDTACASELRIQHISSFLEATCQAKLKILNVIAVCFSKTHSQPSARDI